MVLGINFLTADREGLAGEGRAFASVAEALMAFDAREIVIASRIKLRFAGVVPPLGWEVPEGWDQGAPFILETTLGRALFNEALPVDYPFVNEEITKKELGAIVNDLAERYPKVQVAATLDALKEAGFYWATRWA
jgi:DNA-directed RNA polymerase subunit beta'